MTDWRRHWEDSKSPKSTSVGEEVAKDLSQKSKFEDASEEAESPVQITSEILQFSLYGKRALQDTDSSLPNFEVVSSPNEVRLGPSRVPGESIGVFATTWICEGTEMGPIPGQITTALNPNEHNRWAWEVFDAKDGSQVMHYVDASDENERCWLNYINCARHEQEQNLEIAQSADKNIFYRTIKSIPPNQELLVWYGTGQRLYLGLPGVGLIPLANKTRHPEYAAPSSSSSSNAGLHCVLCHRGFNSKSNLRSHMRTHTLERPFVCRFCHRRFSQSSTLRNHVRLHTGEKPYKCLVCQSAYSQLAGLRAHQKSARHKPSATETTSKT